MLAVESFSKCRREGRGVQIVREHIRPRDGLERSPMPAHGRDERDDQENMAKLAEHATTMENRPKVSNKGCLASNSLALALWLARQAKAELILDGSPARHVAAQTEIDAARFPAHTRPVPKLQRTERRSPNRPVAVAGKKTKRRLLFNQNNFA